MSKLKAAGAALVAVIAISLMVALQDKGTHIKHNVVITETPNYTVKLTEISSRYHSFSKDHQMVIKVDVVSKNDKHYYANLKNIRIDGYDFSDAQRVTKMSEFRKTSHTTHTYDDVYFKDSNGVYNKSIKAYLVVSTDKSLDKKDIKLTENIDIDLHGKY